MQRHPLPKQEGVFLEIDTLLQLSSGIVENLSHFGMKKIQDVAGKGMSGVV